MKFPTVTGTNLLRQKLILPDDFQGGINLVFVPFQQWQQFEVNSWIPMAKELEGLIDGLAFYELPTIQSRGFLSQMMINEGMRAGIPSNATRERTVTLYLDKPSFRQSLDMTTEDHTYVLLVDKLGNVLFSASGSYQTAIEHDLRQVLALYTPKLIPA